jgi:hypothetical protein
MITDTKLEERVVAQSARKPSRFGSILRRS